MQIKERCPRESPSRKCAEGPTSDAKTNLWGDLSVCSSTKESIYSGPLQSNPRQGKGLISALQSTVLTPEMWIQALPTGVYRPFYRSHCRIIIGEKQQGILVVPEVINADFEGETKVITHSFKGISMVKTDQRVAQLIVLPKVILEIKLRESIEEKLGFVHLIPTGYKP